MQLKAMASNSHEVHSIQHKHGRKGTVGHADGLRERLEAPVKARETPQYTSRMLDSV